MNQELPIVPRAIVNAITQYGDSRADNGLASGPALANVIAVIREHLATQADAVPVALGFVNVKYNTYFTPAQFAASDRNTELLASGEVVRVYAHPSPTTAPASETITISEPADRRVFVNQEEAAALNRFAETCEDSEGYDVPKPMMQRLACIGAIRRVTGSIYQFTDFGMWLMEPPTITATEPK